MKGNPRVGFRGSSGVGGGSTAEGKEVYGQGRSTTAQRSSQHVRNERFEGSTLPEELN